MPESTEARIMEQILTPDSSEARMKEETLLEDITDYHGSTKNGTGKHERRRHRRWRATSAQRSTKNGEDISWYEMD